MCNPREYTIQRALFKIGPDVPCLSVSLATSLLLNGFIAAPALSIITYVSFPSLQLSYYQHVNYFTHRVAMPNRLGPPGTNSELCALFLKSDLGLGLSLKEVNHR